MYTNQELLYRKNTATPRACSTLASFFVDHAQGAEIWDVDSNRYIDFGAGVAVLNTGHCHPSLVQAMMKQLKLFTHTAYQIVPYESYVTLAEKINLISPGDFVKKTAFFTTGAEAIENAIKIARAHTKRPGVIALSGGFHGRTMMTLSLTGKMMPYKANFGPFMPSVYHVPAPIKLHGGSVEATLKAIDLLFKCDIMPKDVAAFIFEPIQGEGGFYVMPSELINGLKKICDEYGILLIADEIQTGFARTGKLFAMEYYEVTPDLIAMAKGLAGGMPLSAVTGRSDVMDAPEPGGLGGTYAGNPLAIASAHAVLDVIDSENLCARANVLGNKLLEVLRQAQKHQPRIVDIRGLGSMIAVEFGDPDTIEPDPEYTKRIQKKALEKGLLLLTCGVHNNVIRFLYPLNIADSVFDEGLNILMGIFATED